MTVHRNIDREADAIMRRVFQCILAAPIYIYAPFAWIPLAAALDPTDSTSVIGRLYGFYFGVAAIGGLFALPVSIFGSDSKRKERKKLWIATTVGLFFGLSLAICFLCACWSSINPMSSHFDFLGAWVFGGPAIVAMWNLWRFWSLRNEPNQALLPTPTAVTPAASHPSRLP